MDDRNSRRRLLQGLAASAALGPLSLGCQGREVESISPTAPTFPTALCQAPLRMLYEKKLLQEQGPEGFKLAVMAGWDPVREGLLGGKLHFAYGGLEAMIWVDRGLPFRLLSGIHTGCIKSAAQPGIQGFRDLKGKTIGVNVIGSFTYLLTLHHLHQAGLDPEGDVTIVAISPPDAIPAFRQRKLDAMTMWDPTAALLQELDIPHTMLFDNAVDEGWADRICCFGLVPAPVVEQRPGLARQLQAGITAAAHWLAESDENVQECVRIQIEKNYTPVEPDLQLRLLRSYDFSVSGDQERALESMWFYAEMAREFGAIRSSPREIVERMWVDYTRLPEEA